MNEILNNPIVQKGLNKLGEGFELGATEWVKYIQVKSLMGALYELTMIIIVACVLYKCSKDIGKEIDICLEKKEDAGGIYFVRIILYVLAIILILTCIHSLFADLTGYYAPVGRALDELVKAAAKAK